MHGRIRGAFQYLDGFVLFQLVGPCILSEVLCDLQSPNTFLSDKASLAASRCSSFLPQQSSLVTSLQTANSLHRSMNHVEWARGGNGTCMEQNLGPHMEQKWAVLAGSCGSVASWNRRAVTGSSDRWNWSYLLPHGPHGISPFQLTAKARGRRDIARTRML